MQRGQASLEYVVAVGLVAAVCAVGAATAARAAPGLANGVARGVRHALCVAGGGDCLATERRPCVVATKRRGQEVTVHAAFVRVDRRAAVLREDLSDGTVRITAIDDIGAGGQAGLGVRGRLKAGGLDLGGGGQLQAQALARLGHTRTYHVRAGRAADRLTERLTGSPATMVLNLPRRLAGRALGIDDGLPRADVVSFTAGGDVGAMAQLGGGAGHADLEGAVRASVGGRLDRRNGRRTLFFDVGGEAAGILRAAVARGRLAGDGRLGVALTHDRDGRPLQLAVSAAGDGAGALIAAPGVPGRARLALGGGRRLGVESRLDLTAGDNAAIVARLVAALDPRAPAPRRAAAAAGEVARRLVRDGDLDLRAYSTRTSWEGAGADAALGARVGGGVELTKSSTRLLAAWNRPTGGLWERRLDCVPGRALVS